MDLLILIFAVIWIVILILFASWRESNLNNKLDTMTTGEKKRAVIKQHILIVIIKTLIVITILYGCYVVQ